MAVDLDPRTATQNNGPALLAIAWVFAAIAIVVVASRLYVRLRLVNRFKVDDWFIIATFALAICNTIFCTIAVHWGLGRHIQTLLPDQIRFSIKYIYLCEFFSIMSPCLGRISYTLLLLQLLPPTKWPRRFLWSVICVQSVSDVGTIIISFSQCQPIYEFWGTNPKDYCWDPKVQQYTGFFQGSVGAVVDLTLAFFPASIFWKLQMKLKTKISLSILMGLGVFASACSIKKTIELRAINEKGDPTYAMCNLAIWWTLEAYLVLLAASIPTLRPLTKGANTIKSSIRGGGQSSHNFQNLNQNTIGSRSSRKKRDSQFYILGDTQPEWDSEERLNAQVKAGHNEGVEVRLDRIKKTTTVTLSEQHV